MWCVSYGNTSLLQLLYYSNKPNHWYLYGFNKRTKDTAQCASYQGYFLFLLSSCDPAKADRTSYIKSKTNKVTLTRGLVSPSHTPRLHSTVLSLQGLLSSPLPKYLDVLLDCHNLKVLNPRKPPAVPRLGQCVSNTGTQSGYTETCTHAGLQGNKAFNNNTATSLLLRHSLLLLCSSSSGALNEPVFANESQISHLSSESRQVDPLVLGMANKRCIYIKGI